MKGKRMEKERQKTPKIEETKYHHQIPGKVLEEMTPDMKRQYFLWDEMLKRQIELYHMECQMKPGGNIAVRMLEYDMNIALVHGLEWADAGGNGR